MGPDKMDIAPVNNEIPDWQKRRGRQLDGTPPDISPEEREKYITDWYNWDFPPNDETFNGAEKRAIDISGQLLDIEAEINKEKPDRERILSSIRLIERDLLDTMQKTSGRNISNAFKVASEKGEGLRSMAIVMRNVWQRINEKG